MRWYCEVMKDKCAIHRGTGRIPELDDDGLTIHFALELIKISTIGLFRQTAEPLNGAVL
jgi:hypothetical protein